MKLLVVNNLASGYGDGAIYDFLRAATADGDEVCLRYTDGSTNLDKLVQDAQAFDAVIASGGDGTVATVAYLTANTGVPVLPFPAGTANLLALNLLAPSETHALAKLLENGQTLDFDLGEIEVDGNRYGFGIMAGAGYDATIMKGAAPAKKLLGQLAYFQAAIANPMPQKSHFTLTLDGETVESDGLGILIINFSKIQFDVPITHENQPRDGVLDVAILKADNAFELLPALIAGVMDRGGDYPNRTDSLELHRAKEITVVADPPLQVQYDGEALPLTTPFTARVLPGAAKFIVSDECIKQFQ